MAEDSEFRHIWADAFDIYKKKTGRDIKNESVLQNLNSTEDLLAQINDEERKFSDFREKKRKLWSALSAMTKPLELLGGLTQDTLTLTPFSPCSQVLGAALFLVKSAGGVSSAYDCITNLFEQLEAFTGRLEEYTKATIDLKLQKKVTVILTTLLEIFATSEKLIKDARIKQYLKVTFLGSNEKVAAAMTHLKELMDAEEKLVVSLTYSTTQRMESTVERTERTVEKTEQTLGGIVGSLNESQKEYAEHKKEDAEKKLIEKTLDSDAMTNIREINGNVSEQRLKGSGEWIKRELLFQDWLTKKNPLLLILGSPGAGKSFLSSSIISHLQELHPQDPKHPSRVSLGYFYIKEDNQLLRSLTTILKSLAFQIQTKDSVYKKYVANVCNFPEQITTARSLWKRLFTDFFGSPQYRDSSALLVIDGLDEAPRNERKILIELLGDLEDVPDQNSRPRIQIVLVGRPELHDDINSVWGKTISFVEFSARKNSRDITNYIEKGLKRVKALRIKHTGKQERIKLRQEIVDKITKGANGMFLWVNLMFDQINDKSRFSEIRKALNNAPPGVSEMIRHVFERLSGDPDVGDDLIEMLVWVTCAQQPLLLGQIDTIMKLRSPISETLPDLEELLRLKFASFFILEREDKRTTEDLQHLARPTHTDKKVPTEEENAQDEDQDESISDDLGLSYSFESDFKATTVKFSHASIRDYLVQEGRPETRKYSKLKIGIEMAQAEQHIVATCLRELCSSASKTTDEITSLVGYAADHFMEHLVSLNKDTMSQEDKQTILRSLYLLFSDELIIKHWLDKISDIYEILVKMWLINTKFSACVREWFGEEDVFGDSFTSEERAAMQRMATSDKELLQPLARYCASAWLVGREVIDDMIWINEDWILFLHGCAAIDDYATKDEDGKRVGLDIFLLKSLSTSRIRELAQFIDLDKTASWHVYLASALRQYNHLEAAIREYQISLSIEPSSLGKFGLAQCYTTSGDYTLAIDWGLNALTSCDENQKVLKSNIWRSISEWNLEIGDVDGAIEASKEAFKLSPEEWFTAFSHLSALDAGDRFQEMIDFAEDLGKTMSARTKESILTGMLSVTGEEELASAANALGRLEFVSNAIETSIAAAERKKDVPGTAFLQYRYGCFKLRWLQNTDEAVELWELVLESSNDYPRMCSVRQLSESYFSRAVKSEDQGLSPDPWISKLESLSRQVISSEVDDDLFSTEVASMVLGLWYRLHDKHDKAKACFKAKVLEAIDILTDDDPGNDLWGYVDLGRTLLKAGDKVNAVAAFAFTTTGIEKMNDVRQSRQKKQIMTSVKEGRSEDKESTEETLSVEMNPLNIGAAPLVARPGDATAEPKTFAAPALMVDESSDKADDNSAVRSNDIEVQERGPIYILDCDGNCKNKQEPWKAFYVCEFCVDTAFCDQCVELVRTDRLPFRKCGSNHPFHHIYPNTQKTEDPNTVVVDGKTLLRTEWLASLRKEWEG